MGYSERAGGSGQCRAVCEHQSLCASRTDIPVVPCKEVRGAGSRGRIGGQMRGNDATLRAERRTEVNAVSSTRVKTVAMGGEGGAKPSIKRLFSEGYLPPGFSSRGGGARDTHTHARPTLGRSDPTLRHGYKPPCHGGPRDKGFSQQK